MRKITTLLSSVNKEEKTLATYYAFYCFLFVGIHLLVVSIFSFFHFLLNHDMGIVENWISRNGWELISFAKMSSLFLVIKLIKLNFYEEKAFRKYIKNFFIFPTKRAFVFSLFILVVFYSLIMQFGGGIKSNQFLDDLFFSSFIGSFLFFGTDIVCLFFISKYFAVNNKVNLKWTLVLLFLFLASSKIALPYLSKYFIFLIVHFITALKLGEKGNWGDVTLYLLVIVAPLSSLFGLDLVWDNSYALFVYSEQLPVLGILLIWGTALGYYHYSKLD